jgi:predicted metal-dependent hydrolase
VSTTYIEIENLGRVKLFRRRGLKNIRVSINSMGEVRLSIPWYVPKKAGIKYLLTKKSWIEKHRGKIDTDWTDGQTLFKNYTLSIQRHERVRASSTVEDEILKIYIPHNHDPEARRRTIGKYVSKLAKEEAEKVLIPLALTMAGNSGFKPKKIRVRNLKSRWGSCNQDKVITLNTSLLKLSEDLVEYVIFHELVHTKHMNHSRRFWQEVEALLPDYKQRRKNLKTFSLSGLF